MKKFVFGIVCYSAVTIIGLAQSNVVFQGLVNHPLGAAQLSLSSTLNQLIVGNLGTSGQDGVAIGMTGSNLMGIDVQCLDVDPSNSLPVGEFVQSAVIGPVNGQLNVVLASVRMTKTGTTNYSVTADFSALGTTNCLVQAYRQGVLVGQGATNSGPSTIIRIDKIDDDGTSWNTEFDDENCYKSSTIDCVQSTAMVLPGGILVSADKVYIIPTNIPQIRPKVFQLTASQVPALTITSENLSVSYQGLLCTSLGNAALSAAGSQLVISNLSSSGQDGVSFALPAGAPALDIGWQPMDQSNTLPVGAYVQSRVVGSSGAITNGVLGTLTVTKAGTSNYVISANYTNIGVTTFTLQAYLQGVLVAQATNQSGPDLATEANMATTGDFTFTGGDREGSVSSDSDIQLVLMAGQSVTCDKLEVFPENSPFTNPPTAFQLIPFGVPSMTLTTVAATPLLLTTRQSAQGLKLSWIGSATLQQSSDLNHWADVTGAASPYAVPTTGTSQFFRLRQPLLD